jgi:N-acetylmuramoyl-L-alanine amidase
MKEKILLVILILISTAMLQGKDSKTNNPKKIVVIDAGHGGEDTGAVGLKSKEKDIALAISLKVGEYIEQNMPHVQVIYTRKTDVFIPLKDRAMIANNNNADLFISIHANSNPNKSPSGTETFAMGLHKSQSNLDVAKKENSVIVFEEDYSVKYEGFDPNSSESYIIFSLMQSTYLEKSLEVASFVQDEFRERANRKDRGVKQAGFLVLWQASMPSILIETGFISNPHEEEYLISAEGQSYLASAIYRAVKTYFINIEKSEQSDNNITKAHLTDSLHNSDIIKDVLSVNEVWFRVQVTSSSKPLKLDNPVFKNYSDVFEYYERDFYKYTIGKYKLYDEAKEFYEKIKTDFPGAFIVAFNNNERIELSKAITIIN